MFATWSMHKQSLPYVKNDTNFHFIYNVDPCTCSCDWQSSKTKFKWFCKINSSRHIFCISKSVVMCILALLLMKCKTYICIVFELLETVCYPAMHVIMKKDLQEVHSHLELDSCQKILVGNWKKYIYEKSILRHPLYSCLQYINFSFWAACFKQKFSSKWKHTWVI